MCNTTNCPKPEPKGEDWDYDMWWDAVNSSEESDNE